MKIDLRKISEFCKDEGYELNIQGLDRVQNVIDYADGENIIMFVDGIFFPLKFLSDNCQRAVEFFDMVGNSNTGKISASFESFLPGPNVKYTKLIAELRSKGVK